MAMKCQFIIQEVYIYSLKKSITGSINSRSVRKIPYNLKGKNNKNRTNERVQKISEIQNILRKEKEANMNAQ